MRTEFAVSADVHRVHADEEHPERGADEPAIAGAGVCVGTCPELEHELRGGEVARDGDRVVEPIVPLQRERVRGRHEAGRICAERACARTPIVSIVIHNRGREEDDVRKTHRRPGTVSPSRRGGAG